MRTLLTLEWLQTAELRRGVQIGLNKGEAKNALHERCPSAVILQPPPLVSYEIYRYRASGLNLVVAAMCNWNTIYLGSAV